MHTRGILNSVLWARRFEKYGSLVKLEVVDARFFTVDGRRTLY